MQTFEQNQEFDEWSEEDLDALLGRRKVKELSPLPGDILNFYSTGADFSGMQLSFIEMQSSDLRFSNFNATNLIGVGINNCNLHGSNFRNSLMNFCEIKHSDLSECWLNHAKMAASNLRQVNFSGANLCGVNLEDAQIYKCDFSGAIFDASTVLPFDYNQARRMNMIFRVEENDPKSINH